jgi:hypothetical protein
VFSSLTEVRTLKGVPLRALHGCTRSTYWGGARLLSMTQGRALRTT